jgi:hypothetical protein
MFKVRQLVKTSLGIAASLDSLGCVRNTAWFDEARNAMAVPWTFRFVAVRPAFLVVD